MQFRKILIAIDGSPQSQKAAEAGFKLAKKIGASVGLVSVVDMVVSLTAPDGMPIPQEIITYRREEAEQILNKMIAAHRELIHVQPFLSEGSPEDEILDTAKKWNADLIVIGTHGRTGLSHLLLGSVAESIVRQSMVPVMVVPVKDS